MGLRFIFMLTRNDQTVEDAEHYLSTALEAGIRHIGFKDVGLPFERLKELNTVIRKAGATSYLEVVSLDARSEAASATAAAEIGVDVLLGGTHADAVIEILAGSGIQYFPFPGRIVGHPSVLEGSIGEIVVSAENLVAKDGVHGLDLLAYRSRQDVGALMHAVCATTEKPVIMAGSIDGPQRIQAVQEAGAAGFTIGTAALDGLYPASGADLGSQLRAIMKDVATANKHISPYSKKNLAQSFSAFEEAWSPRVAGKINGVQIRLTKFRGNAAWHFNHREDGFFLVHKGTLKMKFRDRDEILKEGEFIVVPHGVEHCPVAVTEVCEVVMVEPETTLPTAYAAMQNAGLSALQMQS